MLELHPEHPKPVDGGFSFRVVNEVYRHGDLISVPRNATNVSAHPVDRDRVQVSYLEPVVDIPLESA